MQNLTATAPKETPKSTTETQSFTPVKQELVSFLDDDYFNENSAYLEKFYYFCALLASYVKTKPNA